MTTEAAERLDEQAAMSARDALDYLAARHLGGARPPSRATLYRWMRDGVPSRANGALVKLQRELLGGRVITRKGHVDRFWAELNAPPTARSANRRAQRLTHIEAVDVLRAAGL